MMLHKREPVLVAAVLLAVINLALGHDSGISQEAVTSVITLVLGVVVRQHVSPVAQETSSGD